MYSLISDAFTNAIKLKGAVRLKAPLFYSSHTIHLITQRETTFKQLGSDPSFLLALKLRELNLSISDSIELDKELFINQFDLSSTRQCYKLLRSFGFNSSFPPVMFHGNESFFTDSDKALGFNKFFASVFQDKSSHTVPDQLKEPCIKLMNLDFSLSDVLLLFESCDDFSATGADELPSFLLHQCAKVLCAPVFELFFCIVKTQNWPDLWKIAHVTPLHKSGPHNDISNYRPISILPKLSLLRERLLFNFIYPKIRHQIEREQHGFMKSRIKISQMIMYLDSIYSARDTNSPAISIYFDARKAFDSVSQQILLSKPVNFGFDSAFLNLFNAYLTNRSQCAKINQSLSSRLPVTSGVPQGSVLGPLLFIIFVNDSADNVANSCFYLFADDPEIFITSSFSLVQEDINSLFNWCNLNGLHFHPSKCKAVNFGGHDSDKFFLGSDYLPFNNQIEDLGFIVSSTLSWKAHLDSKLLKCNRIFNFLKRSIPFSVSSQRKLLLNRSLILANLLYGATVWSPSSTRLHQLERFQYKVLRLIIRCASYVSG